jgi:hypothetical protein
MLCFCGGGVFKNHLLYKRHGGIDGLDYFTHHHPLLSLMLGIRRIVTMVTLIHFSSVIPKLHIHKANVKKNYIIIERNAIQWCYANRLLL